MHTVTALRHGVAATCVVACLVGTVAMGAGPASAAAATVTAGIAMCDSLHATNPPCRMEQDQADGYYRLGLQPGNQAAEIAYLQAHAGANGTPRRPETSWTNILGAGANVRYPFGGTGLATCLSPGTPTGADGFCFAPSDQSAVGPIQGYDMHPQGHSTSADATGLTADPSRSNTYWGRQMVATGWSAYGPTNGQQDQLSYVTFAEGKGTRSDSQDPRYRKVMLVRSTSTSGEPQLIREKLHLGGIVWYGHYLYATDVYYPALGAVRKGVTVFDLDHIIDVSRNPALRAQADGQRFVLPVAAEWRSVGTLRVPGGSMSLDRDTPRSESASGVSLLLGSMTRPNTMVQRYPLHAVGSPEGPTLATTADDGAGSSSHETATYIFNEPDIGGFVSHGGVLYLSQGNDSTGSRRSGRLYRWDTKTVAPITCTSNWPFSTEDLSYWHTAAADYLFGNTEATRHKSVFDVRVGSLFAGNHPC
jgi:hypothetical protein